MPILRLFAIAPSVDGMKVGDPVTLPGSHGLFQPVATAENWDGGVAGSCNRYDFDFSNSARSALVHLPGRDDDRPRTARNIGPVDELPADAIVLVVERVEVKTIA